MREAANPFAHQSSSRKSEFWAGIRATLPLVVGAIPFGTIFGAVAVTSGISPLGTAAMSAFVFAGSAQFIAAGLVASGTGIAIIILTTFIVNLRHLLYAISLMPYVRHLPQRWLVPLAFWLTDESYLIVYNRYTQVEAADKPPIQIHPTETPHHQISPQSTNGHWFFFGSAVIMYVNWQICTAIGIFAGQSIPDPRKWGLEFALIVVFIGILTPQLKERSVLLCVIVSTGAALLFRHLPNQLGLFVAVLIGVGMGLLVERTQKKAGKGSADE